MLYEISNPSDPYTIEANSLDVAFVACMLLGEGLYAFKPVGDAEAPEIPMFLLGLFGAEPWCQKHLGKSFEEAMSSVLDGKRAELADCMGSCLIGNARDRQTYRDGMELITDPVNREAWHFRWHATRRRSLNDIGGRAYVWARSLRTGDTKQAKGGGDVNSTQTQ